MNEDGILEVSGITTLGTNPVPIPFNPGDIRINVNNSFSSERARALQTITKWNTIDQRLNTFLYNLRQFPEDSIRLDDSKTADIIIDRWGRLEPSDEKNISLSVAAKKLRLSPQETKLLENAGAKTIRDIAVILNAAPEIEKQNNDVNRFLAHLDTDKATLARRKIILTPPETVDFKISAQQALQLRQAIGKGLQKTVGSGKDEGHDHHDHNHGRP
ncbi:MAG: hypothetical protein KDD14_25510 [Saprospiraceae bacterium]|nr:hypothetical protein [Saprospiraceae bacterium]